MIKLAVLLLFIAVAPVPADTALAPVPECGAVPAIDIAGRIDVPGYSSTASPGDPALPFTELNVVIPPDADPASVSVALKDPRSQLLPGLYGIPPAPPIVTVTDGLEVYDWGRGKQIESGRNVSIYGADAFYPPKNVELVCVGNLRKWQIARVRYYPYRYNPVSRRLDYTTASGVEVFYTLNSTSAASAQSQFDEVFAEKLRRLSANYEQARAWYPSPSGALATASPQDGYAIITTSAIVAGSAKLQEFVNVKTQKGFSVSVVTESAWGGGTGDAAANRIRSYLKANYAAKGIRYVLLIGNPSTAAGDVPMKMLWPRFNYGTYREAPSDYFYADLTGEWDRDHDGYYGEWSDDFGIGGVDLYPEVIVGRIPFYGSFTDLDSILSKTIAYDSGNLTGQWMRRVLLSMEPSDSDTPGYHLGEAIKHAAADPGSFPTTRVYEQTYGLSPAPDYTPCSYDTVLGAWQKHAGFHFWWSHGSDTVASDVITSDRCQYLDNNFPSFTFQVSCLNGNPDNSANLGYSLLRQGAIATDSASRVSWYAPGQTDFTSSDTNAGMAYGFASRLVKEHEPCGDAHFDMMLDVPNAIWMNHCVYNLYGDPSLAYPDTPVVRSTPLKDTENTTSPYPVSAEVISTSPLAPNYPCIKWNTDGGSVFSTAAMSLVSGSTYGGAIPPQPYNTVVYYYVAAQDSSGHLATSPPDAPAYLYSFRVSSDVQPPAIVSKPLSDTHDMVGPYVAQATVTDNSGVSAAKLYYNINGGADTCLVMSAQGADTYEARIPGPMNFGDSVNYYITASDVSLNANSARSPSSTGYYTFKIAAKRCVAVYNCSSMPSYFNGGNSNIYAQIADVLNADSQNRFSVTVVTRLNSSTLADRDAIVLPDNAVMPVDAQAVSDWFVPGKVILGIDSAANYGAYTGWMWPDAAGTNGCDTFWDYNSSANDSQIWLQDPATVGYSVGQSMESRGYESQFRVDRLPHDAFALAGRSDRSFCYTAYRDVPGKGRFALLGPFMPPLPTQFSLIREALLPPKSKGIRITSPVGGSAFAGGDPLTVSYQMVGTWLPTETIGFEYCTGLDGNWQPIPGTQDPAAPTRSYTWNTSGLPGSHGYKVRAVSIGGSITGDMPAPFSIVPTIGIAEAKATGDRQIVRLAAKAVISAVAGYCYVEEPSRTAGIRVRTAQNLPLSTSVTLTGAMNTLDGERVLDVETVEGVQTGPGIAAWAMSTDGIGGGEFGLQQALDEYRRVRAGDMWVRRLLRSTGLGNIGLLVRVVGRVTSVGADYFYIDDGAGCDDGSGQIGVRVICPGLAKPELGWVVSATCVSSTYSERAGTFRALVLPRQEDWRLVSR